MSTTSIQRPATGRIAPPAGVLRRYFRRLVTGIPSLLIGLGITLRKLIDPRTVVTRQYPEQQPVLPPAVRGQVVMPHDAQGEHKCTACTICEKACPNGSISVLTTRNIAGRKVLGRYIYRLDQCTQCGLCVEACPFDAIRMGQGHELATTDKDDLVLVLNRKEGR